MNGPNRPYQTYAAKDKDGFRWCSQCEEVLPLSQFACRSKARQGRSPLTRTCRKCRSRLHREKSYFKRFGLTWEEYQAMLVKQNYRCLACGREADRGRGPWSTRPSLVLDHNHKTGKHRALVCNRCNWAIGVLENTKLVKKLKKYLALFDEDL